MKYRIKGKLRWWKEQLEKMALALAQSAAQQ